jgi:hypothetical protein
MEVNIVDVYKCHLSEKVGAVCVQTLQVQLHTAVTAKTCCECERSFCQDVTCVWLPLQLCCGDDVHLCSFLQYVSTACSDRQQ